MQGEIVALTLVVHFLRQSLLVLMDALYTLQLLWSWGFRSTSKVLCGPEYCEERQSLVHWANQRTPPALEKGQGPRLCCPVLRLYKGLGEIPGGRLCEGGRWGSHSGLQDGSALLRYGSLSGLFGGNSF